MAAPKIATRGEWEARALELAEAAHLTGTARLVAEKHGRRLWEVPSADRRQVYGVAFDTLTGAYRCACLAGQHGGRACKHAGAALHGERLRLAAMSRPDVDPLTSWCRGFDW